MGLRKRSKIEATFSMSSLTDIIFLLLIFFMLTSSLVTPNALNLKLPGRDNTSVTSDSKVSEISINSKGKYRYDNKRVTLDRVASNLRRLAKKRKPVITLAPDKNAPVESVVAVMDLAMRYHIETVMAAEMD